MTDELSIIEVQLRASIERLDYSQRMRALLAQRAAETKPIRVTPRGFKVICFSCREPMLDGSGQLHRGECGACRKHTRGTIHADPIRPYGPDAA